MSQIKAALFGQELSHSLSASVHKEIFAILAPKFNLAEHEFQYLHIECSDAIDFKNKIFEAKQEGLMGANVTYPFKQEAYRIAERHVGASATIQSANTIKCSTAILESASTDGQGFLNALVREIPNFHLDPYHLVILGSGAVATAIVYSLCTRWMPLSLTIVNRSMEKAQALAEFCVSQAPGPSVAIMSINDFINTLPHQRRRMVIQATPLGQTNALGNIAAGFSWDTSDLAVDVVYNPMKTTFLLSASGAGAKTLGGLGMLIEQAALSQVFWFSGLMSLESPLTEEEFQLVYSRVAKTIE